MNGGKTSLATLAGVLDIAGGVLALVGGLVLLVIGALGSTVLATAPDTPLPVRWFPALLFGGLALLLFVAGIIALIGGSCALRRSGWGWALAGAVAALVAFFPLGIAAIVCTVMGEDEIRQPAAPAPPGGA
jgi:hypothetical protein